MSNYFPFGVLDELTKSSVSYAFLAVTASNPQANTITVPRASYAAKSGSTPAAGSNGTSITFAQCQSLLTSSNFVQLIPYIGTTGGPGPTGSRGTDLDTCPAGTIECTDLHQSLSLALPGYPNGINNSLPSGSRFSKVCMQVPAGCTGPQCPPYLYTASLPTLP